MIFGSTHAQRRESQDVWKRAFAWWPVQLSDGRWIWRRDYLWRKSRLSPDPGVRTHSVWPYMQRVLTLPPERSTKPKWTGSAKT